MRGITTVSPRDDFMAQQESGRIKSAMRETEKPLMLSLRQFLSEISVAGARYIANQNIGTIRRISWTFLVCFGLGFATYQISEQVRMYFSYPVTVKMNVKDVPLLEFPTITVCNENVGNKSKLKEMDSSGDLSWAFGESYGPVQLSEAEINYGRIVEVFAAWNSSNWDELYRNVFFNYENLLIDCHFDGVICSPVTYTTVITNAGRCLQFNPYGNLTTEVVGSANGLQLVLTADVEQYNNPLSASAGYRVLIHHHSDVIATEVMKKAVKVDVNHHTQIQLGSEKVKGLAEPYGTCRDDDGYVYSKCSFKCYENYMIQNCHCGFPSYLQENITICPVLVAAVCSVPFERKYIMDKIETKECNCPKQCLERVYPRVLSSGAFSDYFIEWMQRVYKRRQLSRRYIQRNLVFLDIYFDSLQETEMVTQPAYTLLSLLCDIGGALGLILGSTVLTLFEIFDFFFYAAPQMCSTTMKERLSNNQ